MYQLIKFDQPIPSCEIHSLEWNKQKEVWTFVYAVQTPVEITNENDKDLMVYEHILDLRVVSGEEQHSDAVNIHFKTLDQYVALLEAQRLADLVFRKRWISDHPGIKRPEWSLKPFEHKDWSHAELKAHKVHCIASFVERNWEEDVFAVV